MNGKMLSFVLFVACVGGMVLASERQKVGEAKLVWDSHGGAAFLVGYKGNGLLVSFLVNYKGYTKAVGTAYKGKDICGSRAGLQVGKLSLALIARGKKFIQKNKLSFGYIDWFKSFIFNSVDLGAQTVYLYNDGSTSYEGKDSLKEEFEQDAKTIFDDFETLHDLQRRYHEIQRRYKKNAEAIIADSEFFHEIQSCYKISEVSAKTIIADSEFFHGLHRRYKVSGLDAKTFLKTQVVTSKV